MTSSGAISYTYDGHNRRVKKVNGSNIQYSLYNQSGQFLSTTGTNGPTEYIYLGSQLVARISQVVTADDKPGYTGHLEDKDIGLTYMQQRYYDPVIGRFYSNDPVGFSADSPITFNRYAYGNNNPYKYVDPDGQESIGIMSMDRDIRSLMSGDISKEDYLLNIEARAAGAMIGATVAATSIGALNIGSSLGPKAVFNVNRSGHIFRNAKDHVGGPTQSSQGRFAKLFEQITRKSNKDSSVLTNHQKSDSSFTGYSKKFNNGTVWVQTRNGQIVNAGVKGSDAAAAPFVVNPPGRLRFKN